MRWRKITPENTEFVMLCFEGPDQYSFAGGLGARVSHLSLALVKMGFTTHLFFIGNPDLQGEEIRFGGKLILHRWCQWISRYYLNGVYEGEEGKLYDFTESIPWFVKERVVKPTLVKGKLVVILGEEWQTTEAMCRLSDVLHSEGLRERVVMFWNANNTFSFDRIDWGWLNYATTITTVSRYMKHIMWRMRLNPLVIPNGIPISLLRRVDDAEAGRVKELLDADMVLCKVARWDPAKRWRQAVEATARLNDMGMRTVLVARGGTEPYGEQVIDKARALGLKVKEATTFHSTHDSLSALRNTRPAHVVDIRSPLPLSFLRVLYRASDGVLANSGHEPFGLVGLETMAAGGVAFTGCTGEDYAIPFVNSFVLETSDPMEIVHNVTYLREYPEESTRIRQAARHTARYFTWDAALKNLITKLENQARIQEILVGKPKAAPLPLFELEDGAPEDNSRLMADTGEMAEAQVMRRVSYQPHHTKPQSNRSLTRPYQRILS